MDAPLNQPRQVAVGSRPFVRVPIVDHRLLLPVGVASVAIVALGLAGGGYGRSSWWPTTIAFVAVGLAAIVIDPHISPGNPARLTVAALCGLTAWTALSASWAPDGALALVDARREVLYVAALVALLLVAEIHPRALAFGALSGTGALTGIALAAYLLPLPNHAADPFEGYLLSEPVGYANAVGILAGVGAVLALLLRPGQATLHAQRLGAMISVACVAALELSGSRGGALAALVGLVVAIALTSHRRPVVSWLLALAPGAALALVLCSFVDVRGAYPRFDEGRCAILAAGLLAAALVSAIAAPALGALLARRLRVVRHAAAGFSALAVLSALALATHAGTFTDSRLAYWRVAVDMARDHPLHGAGSGSFASYWEASGADRGALDAHGAFMEAAAELGLPGLLLLGLVLLVPLVVGVRARATPWVAVATGAYTATVVHAALDWDLELPVVVIVSSALAASLLTAHKRSS